jgi:DNA-binding transcriptional LysR family regulator
MKMELRHLRYFIAVAEHMNFTRAARHLNIAQPPLTQQIKALEADLGVTLFDRSSYRIALTSAGKVFAADVRRILADVRAAELKARSAASGATGQVRVGFTESASFNSLVTAIFSKFRVAHPDVEMFLEEHPSTALAIALCEDRIDVAFLRPPLRLDDGLMLTPLEKEPMVAAIPRNNPLAKRKKSIALRELQDQNFILYPRAVRPGLADAVIAACKQAGFVPTVSQYAPQLSSTINLVAASLGVSIVPRSMQGLQPYAVAYLELRGEPIQAQLGIAHRAKEESPAVLSFVSMARAMSEAQKTKPSRRGARVREAW